MVKIRKFGEIPNIANLGYFSRVVEIERLNSSIHISRVEEDINSVREYRMQLAVSDCLDCMNEVSCI